LLAQVTSPVRWRAVIGYAPFLPLLVVAVLAISLYACLCASLSLQEARARWRPLGGAAPRATEEAAIPKIIHQMCAHRG
jgi:hypothetical protein